MKPEQRIEQLEKQVKEMQSYILGMTGNLNYKNVIGKFAKEEVVQQAKDLGSVPNDLKRTISLSGLPEDIKVFNYPDTFVFIRDKNNRVYKVPAYDITL